MSQIQSLLTDAAHAADLRNAEVISEAFRRVESCDNCEYPRNAEKFRRLLKSYADSKLLLHKCKRNLSIHERCAHAKPYHGCVTCASLLGKVIEAEKESRHRRWFLQQIWPCGDCMDNYNPTSRTNRSPASTPLKKEFFNV